ncbi:CBS domain-containing protein [Pedobacter sp. HMF7647]|uniref:CBS domain-containing protein n=1 Tax=Hufsiella arboris TaxID=2695275 RepID=A0A7K1YAG6_9SPHI|nr:CBS domain-containing protein [Hufsiella arboris]MXV51420.1 CBS domain-containing protein [Hufsiella arboris]
MEARELIADVIPPLKTSDSVQKAFDRMGEFRVNHLPVVNDNQFLGLLADDDLIEVSDYQAAIGSLSLSLHNPFVRDNQHIYDVVNLFYELKISVVPVLDATNNYLGLISLNTMNEYFATIASVKDPGGIIVLEINNRNNSLAHVSQIIESDNAQILSSYIQSFPDSTRLELTLKINRSDISTIVASLLRYDYVVVHTYNNHNDSNDSTDRYDQLMNYLNM